MLKTIRIVLLTLALTACANGTTAGSQDVTAISAPLAPTPIPTSTPDMRWWYIPIENRSYMSFYPGPAMSNQDEKIIGIRKLFLESAMAYIGYEPVERDWLHLEVTNQEKIITFQEVQSFDFGSESIMPGTTIQTRLTISNANEESLNSGLFAGLYLAAHWLDNPEKMQEEIFSAESYGLTIYYALQKLTYDDYVQRMTELGRQPIEDAFWQDLQKEFKKAGLEDLPLFFP